MTNFIPKVFNFINVFWYNIICGMSNLIKSSLLAKTDNITLMRM